MCGRYASTRSSTDLATLFDAADDTGGVGAPGFNVAPTRQVPVVRLSRTLEGRAVSAATWGLVPPWAKDPSMGTRMINARAETVATSRAYGKPFRRKRCLVPADGWYEWRRTPVGGKQPYFMTDPGGEPLLFAGLWEFWGRTEPGMLTCTVLTTEAVGEFARVHDRMPLLVTPDRVEEWLGERDVDGPETLLRPPRSSYLESIEIRPVSRAVGNVRNDGPQLIERQEVEEPVPPDGSGAPTLFLAPPVPLPRNRSGEVLYARTNGRRPRPGAHRDPIRSVRYEREVLISRRFVG